MQSESGLGARRPQSDSWLRATSEAILLRGSLESEQRSRLHRGYRCGDPVQAGEEFDRVRGREMRQGFRPVSAETGEN
ncbi:hypothetical protein GCM10009590_29860 [Brachybacterium alimentarium]